MNKFLASVQSFVHSVTTNDRYASYESQYRSSPNSRGALASEEEDAALNPASGNRPDSEGFSSVGIVGGHNSSSTSVDQLNSPYQANPANNHSATNLASSSQTSLNRVPYSPGMRSAQIGNGGIPLQDYAEGAPPPPAPALSWRRIDRWMDNNYPELYDQVCDEVSSADLNELESDLDCSLPLDVRDSYMIHDGQENGGKPTGIIFGIQLLTLEDIAEEWGHWKNTAVRINKALRQQQHQQQRTASSSAPESSSQASSSSSAPPPPPPKPGVNMRRTGQAPRLSWLNHQESVPDGAIQKVYAHPGWIPLAKDGEGNNIAVDLAPGPRGRWGQVILFGRDFDRKYVVANCWANFLSTFADDLENGDHYVFEHIDEGELRFRAPNGRLVSYFDVLRSRVDRQIRHARKTAAGSKSSGPVSQPSAASSSRHPPKNRQTSASSTRNSSPSNLQKLSSPRLDQSGGEPEQLVSPIGSSTNLPATGLSTSSAASKNSAPNSPPSTSAAAAAAAAPVPESPSVLSPTEEKSAELGSTEEEEQQQEKQDKPESTTSDKQSANDKNETPSGNNKEGKKMSKSAAKKAKAKAAKAAKAAAAAEADNNDEKENDKTSAKKEESEEKDEVDLLKDDLHEVEI